MSERLGRNGRFAVGLRARDGSRGLLQPGGGGGGLRLCGPKSRRRFVEFLQGCRAFGLQRHDSIVRRTREHERGVGGTAFSFCGGYALLSACGCGIGTSRSRTEVAPIEGRPAFTESNAVARCCADFDDWRQNARRHRRRRTRLDDASGLEDLVEESAMASWPFGQARESPPPLRCAAIDLSTR